MTIYFGHVQEAYSKYSKAMDAANTFFIQNGDCPRYRELLEEADGFFEDYRELEKIHAAGGEIDDWL